MSIRRWWPAWVLGLLLVAAGLWWANQPNPTPTSDCLGTQTLGDGLQRQPGARRLTSVLHAFTGQPQDMRSLVCSLREAAPSDVWVPKLPFSSTSRAQPADVLAQLVSQLDKHWLQGNAQGQAYEELVIVGHSLGSLFARKLYVLGRGGSALGPSLAEPGLDAALRAAGGAPLLAARPWALATRRIVLMAGINRGWTVSHHMDLGHGLLYGAGVTLARWAQAAGTDPFIVMAGHRGAAFLSQLRLQWLALSQLAAADQQGLAKVVQLLGTRDDLVPPSDNVDPLNDFVYLEVPNSGHRDVIDMAASDSIPEAWARQRREVFQRALGDAPTSDLHPARPHQQGDANVRHVIFVIHGIRDQGFWTERVAHRVQAELLKTPECQALPPGARCVAQEVSSYGYFPMLSFLQPGARQQKVEWLMDRYTEAKARFPQARFSYVGHSHGSYLLKEAMRDYPAVRFERVLLAGSVLRSDQRWHDWLDQGRIGQLLNLTADADWVVALFPNGLEALQLQDLGGAGHHGFSDQHPRLLRLPQSKHLHGGHGAGVEEAAWPLIARFIAGGQVETGPAPLADRHAPLTRWGAPLAPAVWVLGPLLLLWGLMKLLRSRLREWIKTVAVLGYLGLIWGVLTQV
ncbi:alpha-beta hydrolase superfamily lysophospholipase [Inhella inkyongensis]|uniref:Alpha-beta hydrolase superfamily lysophospholipase n=1 Tax=Inhella inkyongensis TaxID=392593 RepID=A0A840S8I9_9BURK|nr:hypothetical protein [Inhella inkyongensis]MBB5204750.1 alpha-beta hydrolase superfamily lysophospholipase [Inhella inkyongensis]